MSLSEACKQIGPETQHLPAVVSRFFFFFFSLPFFSFFLFFFFFFLLFLRYKNDRMEIRKVAYIRMAYIEQLIG